MPAHWTCEQLHVSGTPVNTYRILGDSLYFKIWFRGWVTPWVTLHGCMGGQPQHSVTN